MASISPKPCRQLVYASVAATPQGPQALEALLAVSRRRNRETGITGLLICHAGAYLQCLEGEPAAVDETFARIRRDPRHERVEVLLDEALGARSFAAWDMACTDVPASRWLELATAEWEFNRDTRPGHLCSPGLALLEQVWAGGQGPAVPWPRRDVRPPS